VLIGINRQVDPLLLRPGHDHGGLAYWHPVVLAVNVPPLPIVPFTVSFRQACVRGLG